MSNWPVSPSAVALDMLALIANHARKHGGKRHARHHIERLRPIDGEMKHSTTPFRTNQTGDCFVKSRSNVLYSSIIHTLAGEK